MGDRQTDMSYLVLARKWRPKSFSEVIGQQHVLQALINGLNQNRLHHAFLFAGTRGVGKTTLARILAKSLNCEQGVSATPCGQCSSCQEVDAGRFVDLIEVDAASRTKVDDTRELLDNVQYAPSRGRYKVYLIDEVHMLSTSSFNALLKTLEEPPPHVKFLFATTDPQKLPVTILSRCLQFNLRRLTIKQITDHLADILSKEAIDFEIEALQQLAHAADGSMRDALSLLDQAIGFGDGRVDAVSVHQMLGNVSQHQLLGILQALTAQDGQNLLHQAAELGALGRDVNVVLDALMNALQRIATLQLVPDSENPDSSMDIALQPLVAAFSVETVQLLYQIALHGKRDMPYAADPQSGFEMTLLRMLHFQPHAHNFSIQDTPPKKSPAAPDELTAEPPKSVLSPPADNPPQAPDAQTSSNPKQPLKNTIAEPEPKSMPVTESAGDTDLSLGNWTQLVAKLKLSAITRQLADHCAFVEASDQHITLLLAKDLAHLATENAKAKLQVAVSKTLGYEVKLVFETTDDKQSHSEPTLAGERAQQQANHQQQAEAAIHNDPVVEVIKKTFNARIIDSTIKPLN
ncbi:MAG: DNA polymerase III subunit gamma/tau [Methylophaga sp.]|nr:DNA polymerase III subunit gamma/tau [Methylophaga sp.]